MRHSILSVAGALMLASGMAVPLSASAQPMGYGAPVYGSELMTDQEREEYRERLSNAETAEERERIRSDHHERMQERADERGIILPDPPPRDGAEGMPGAGYDGRERMERGQMEHRERGPMENGERGMMEHRERGEDSDRGSGMGGGGGRY